MRWIRSSDWCADEALGYPLGVYGPGTSRTGVRRHREQFCILSPSGCEIEGFDFLVSEEGIEDAVFFGRPEGDELSGEGFADLDVTSEQRGRALLLDFAQVIARRVFERLDDVL